MLLRFRLYSLRLSYRAHFKQGSICCIWRSSFKPLRWGYWVFPKSNPAFSQSHIVSTGHCAVRGRELVGEVHDENCASLGGVSGHAGLFGSIDGVIDCLELLFEEEKFFSKNQKLIPISRSNDGLLGLRQNSQNSVKPYADGKAMGHLGFTGTSFYINPETADYIVFLTNRVYHGRLNQKIAKYRKQTHSIIQEFQSNRP